MKADVESPAAAVAGSDHWRYWMALYRRDVRAAEAIVEDWLAREPPQRVYLRLLEPALSLSGTLFARGRIGFRDEHFVTYHTLRFLRRVRRAFVVPRPTGPLALATGVWQESHLIGLRMVCDFLQHDNWRIDWFPSNDRATVRDLTRRRRPAAVLLSVGLDRGVEPARRLVGELRQRAGYDGLIVVGGAAVNRDPEALLKTIGADLTATNGLELVRRLRARTRGVVEE
jgi:methanogenic corrinoid protein MtbC1